MGREKATCAASSKQRETKLQCNANLLERKSSFELNRVEHLKPAKYVTLAIPRVTEADLGLICSCGYFFVGGRFGLDETGLNILKIIEFVLTKQMESCLELKPSYFTLTLFSLP